MDPGRGQTDILINTTIRHEYDNQNFTITSELKIPRVLPPHSVGSKLKWEIHLTIDLEHHKQSRSLKYPLEISSHPQTT